MTLRMESLGVALAVLSISFVACGFEPKMKAIDSSLEKRSIEELRKLFNTQQRLVKAHAAESLLKFGYPQGIYEEFLREWDIHKNESGYRVVIMRVLSRGAETHTDRDAWINRIRDVFVDRTQPDRLYAIECLAKLKYPVQAIERNVFEEATNSQDPQFAILTRWTLASTDYRNQEQAFVDSLRSVDSTARYCAAYVLRQSPKISDEAKAAVKKAAQAEKPGTLAFSYLNGASMILSSTTDMREVIRSRDELAKLAATGDRDELREICAAFAECGTQVDIPVISTLLKHPDPDVREAALHALVPIARRIAH